MPCSLHDVFVHTFLQTEEGDEVRGVYEGVGGVRGGKEGSAVGVGHVHTLIHT